MSKEVILLGTHFLFKEELGSRLRGVGHVVYPFDNTDDLLSHLGSEKNKIKLVIIDLQFHPAGGLKTIEKLVEKGIPVLAIGEHKKTDDLNNARELGANKVILNSQAAEDIEKYVLDILKNS